MKLTSILAVLLALAAAPVFAEEPAAEAPPAEQAPPEGKPPRMVPPLIAALDANKDGEISAEEIANAAESLKSLDKNGDGKLTREELFPHPPEGGPGGAPVQPPHPPKGEGKPPQGEGKPPKVLPPIDGRQPAHPPGRPPGRPPGGGPR